LSRHDSVVEHARVRFAEECTKADARLRRAFAELRASVAERETQLIHELASVKLDGNCVTFIVLFNK
jgi:hypothetical protein